MLDRLLPFKLHQSYRPLPRFIREFNPALQEIWSGLQTSTVEPYSTVVDPVKRTSPDRLQEESTINSQVNNEEENYLPAMNPAEVDIGRDGDTVGVETCRSKCLEETELPELSEPMNEKMLKSSGLSDIVSEEAQIHNQTPSVQDGFSSHLAMDDDLEGIGTRRSKRQCGPPDKLQYHKLGNPLKMVIQSLLQGLSSALATSLEGSTSTDQSLNMPGTFPQW